MSRHDDGLAQASLMFWMSWRVLACPGMCRVTGSHGFAKFWLKFHDAAFSCEDAMPEFQDHPRFIGDSELTIEALLPGGDEAKARVEIRMAHHYDYFVAKTSAFFYSTSDQLRANSFALELGQDRHRTERDRFGAGIFRFH